jgi:hypothetical protein
MQDNFTIFIFQEEKVSHGPENILSLQVLMVGLPGFYTAQYGVNIQKTTEETPNF